MSEEKEEIKNLRTNLSAACNMVQNELMILQELIQNPEKTEKEILEVLKCSTVGVAVASYLTVTEKAHRLLDLLNESEYNNINYENRTK